MAQSRWMSPSLGHGMRSGTVPNPVLRICVDSPHGVTAAQFGRLLTAMEELWLSRVGGSGQGALRIIEVGNGSVWARIVAESRNAPMATFAAFVATVTACSPDWNQFSSGSGSMHADYVSFGTPSPERKFIDAYREITTNGGIVDIRVESDQRKERPLSAEKRKTSSDELTEAKTSGSTIETQFYAPKWSGDDNKK